MRISLLILNLVGVGLLFAGLAAAWVSDRRREPLTPGLRPGLVLLLLSGCFIVASNLVSRSHAGGGAALVVIGVLLLVPAIVLICKAAWQDMKQQVGLVRPKAGDSAGSAS